jgi:hypothetical protein
VQLGVDGVKRSLDADRHIVDAVGLTARQIEIWFEGMPAAARTFFKEEDFKGVDESKVPRADWFQYDQLPTPMSKELQDKTRKEISERNIKEQKDE